MAVTVGFTKMGHMMKVLFRAALSKFKLAQFTAEANTKDLEILAGMIENKKVRLHIEKVYPFEKTPEAIAYIESMRTKGKVVMVWDEELNAE